MDSWVSLLSILRRRHKKWAVGRRPTGWQGKDLDPERLPDAAIPRRSLRWGRLRCRRRSRRRFPDRWRSFRPAWRWRPAGRTRRSHRSRCTFLDQQSLSLRNSPSGKNRTRYFIAACGKLSPRDVHKPFSNLTVRHRVAKGFMAAGRQFSGNSLLRWNAAALHENQTCPERAAAADNFAIQPAQIAIIRHARRPGSAGRPNTAGRAAAGQRAAAAPALRRRPGSRGGRPK